MTAEKIQTGREESHRSQGKIDFNALADRLVATMQEIDEHAVASRQRMAESRKKLDEASEKFMAAIKQAEKEELTAFRWGATQTARAIRPMKTVRFKNTR